MSDESTKVRLDKWLWAARFYKTRALAAEEIDRGRVSVNDAAAKPGARVAHRRPRRSCARGRCSARSTCWA